MLTITGTTDDGTSPGTTLTATFFNGYETNRDLTQNQRIIITGTLTGNNGTYSLEKPVYEHTPTLLSSPITPIYPATKHVSTETIADATKNLLPTLIPEPDPLPETIRTQHNLAPLHQAQQHIHHPTTQAQQHAAQTRLTYDEALAMQLALAQKRHHTHTQRAHPLTKTSGGIIDEYTASLPYSLTDGQLSAINRVYSAQAQGCPLNALLLGDVGAGKTTIAAYALLQAVHNGFTSALVAPTEVLAEQHYESFQKTMPSSVTVKLLTGTTDPEDAADIRELIKAGQPGIIIGTHALFSKRVTWSNLATVVIDEQHRFGVAQRDTFNKLATKPHTIAMSATPIPRTIAMTVYGDLDIITLPGLPTGRKPVQTHIINTGTHPHHYQRMWQKISEEAAAGHQTFIVAPKIDPHETTNSNETPATWTVYDIAKELTRQAPHLTFSVLHSKMDPDEKNRIMADFAKGTTHVLISTTVIEVGVNIPNATIITIINADRFGAAQLHQLRGRVGRGNHQGYCFLTTTIDPTTDTKTQKRLTAIANTLDGTLIAEIDLQTRGEGHILGTRQAGNNGLKLLNLTNHTLIKTAHHDAETLTQQDPNLTQHPALAAWLYGHSAYQNVEALMRT